jgi:hypothetical protein
MTKMWTKFLESLAIGAIIGIAPVLVSFVKGDFDKK